MDFSRFRLACLRLTGQCKRNYQRRLSQYHHSQVWIVELLEDRYLLSGFGILATGLPDFELGISADVVDDANHIPAIVVTSAVEEIDPVVFSAEGEANVLAFTPSDEGNSTIGLVPFAVGVGLSIEFGDDQPASDSRQFIDDEAVEISNVEFIGQPLITLPDEGSAGVGAELGGVGVGLNIEFGDDEAVSDSPQIIDDEVNVIAAVEIILPLPIDSPPNTSPAIISPPIISPPVTSPPIDSPPIDSPPNTSPPIVLLPEASAPIGAEPGNVDVGSDTNLGNDESADDASHVIDNVIDEIVAGEILAPPSTASPPFTSPPLTPPSIIPPPIAAPSAGSAGLGAELGGINSFANGDTQPVRQSDTQNDFVYGADGNYLSFVALGSLVDSNDATLELVDGDSNGDTVAGSGANALDSQSSLDDAAEENQEENENTDAAVAAETSDEEAIANSAEVPEESFVLSASADWLTASLQAIIAQMPELIAGFAVGDLTMSLDALQKLLDSLLASEESSAMLTRIAMLLLLTAAMTSAVASVEALRRQRQTDEMGEDALPDAIPC